ncbi:MAG TPA: alpha amylase C-terminal domain-containing protein, partial [Nevskiaceae bacterium]|nr:alpha amylase C-terminal domain-containing protein [Nevskiaceae bacterium]
QSIFAWYRAGTPEHAPVLVLCNFTPVPRIGYRVGVPRGGRWRELLNSDAALYGGSNIGNAGAVEAAAVLSHGLPYALTLTLPPLAVVLLTCERCD